MKSLTSVDVAKDRLKMLLASDRVHCKPDIYDMLYNELHATIRKYLAISEKDFNVEFTRNKIYITLTGEES